MNGMIRGLDYRHEHAAQFVARDTRPLGVRVEEFLTNPIAGMTIFVAASIIIILFPILADLIFITCFAIFLFVRSRKLTLPFKLPQSSQELDYHDLKPGTIKPGNASGISFFGLTFIFLKG